MRDNLKKLDKPLLIVVILFCVFGLVMIFSASNIAAVLQYKETAYYFFSKQLLIEIIAFFLSLIVICIPTKSYRVLSVIGIISIFILLFLLRTYGTVTNSAQSWFKIFGFSVQPSEFAKTFIILFLACWYGGIKKFEKKYDLFIPLIPCIVIFGLVASEPDLGTASIIAFICMFIFFSLPVKNGMMKKLMYLALICGGLGIVFLNSSSDILTETQANRFNFKNPCERYLEDTGYQVCNGYIAINNGGILGTGLGKSTQKYLYLPESYTDFIFPIIVEELGVVGGGAVMVFYIILLYRILVIARNATNLRNSIIAFGTFSYILIHIVVNFGGLLALMPMTGVPLPFLSYGGSFAINLIILIALTQRVAIESKEPKKKRA